MTSTSALYKNIILIATILSLIIMPVMADNFLISIPETIPSYYNIYLDTSKVYNSYSIRFTNSVSGTYLLKGSNDLSGWTTLDTQSNISFTNDVDYNYNIASPASYQYYQLYFAYGFDSAGTNVNLNLYETNTTFEYGSIDVFDKGNNFIYWKWNPINITKVIVDDNLIPEPSSGYYIYRDLNSGSKHRITTYYQNGTNYFIDTEVGQGFSFFDNFSLPFVLFWLFCLVLPFIHMKRPFLFLVPVFVNIFVGISMINYATPNGLEFAIFIVIALVYAYLFMVVGENKNEQ